MNSQLFALGFRPDDPQQLYTLLSVAAERSLPVLGSPKGAEHRLYVDPSGAALAVHRSSGKIDALTPWLESDTVWPLDVTGFVPDPETVHWSGAKGTVLAPDGPVPGVTVHIKDVSAWRPLLQKGGRFMLQMAVIGDDVQVFSTPDELGASLRAAFGKNERGEELALPRSFILPTGSAAGGGTGPKPAGGGKLSDIATALIAGTVTAFETRENTLCRKPFRVARIVAAGLDTEVAFWKTRDGREPRPGEELLAHSWLAGTPLGVTPPEEAAPGGLLSKLFSLRAR